MNESKNPFIWKSNLSPVESGVLIDPSLLLHILKFLDENNIDESNTIPWDEFCDNFGNIDRDKLLNHINYASEMNYISRSMKFNIKLDRKFHDVRGKIKELKPSGRDYIEAMQRERRAKRATLVFSLVKSFGLIIFGGIAATYAPKIFDVFLNFIGIKPW